MPSRLSTSQLRPAVHRPVATPAPAPRELPFTPNYVYSPVTKQMLPSPQAMAETMAAVKQRSPAIGTLGARAIESLIADDLRDRRADGLPLVSKLSLQEGYVDLANMLHAAVTTGDASGDLRERLTMSRASPNASPKTRDTLKKLEEMLAPHIAASAVSMPKAGPVSAAVKVFIGGKTVEGRFTATIKDNQLTGSTITVGGKAYALSHSALREVVRRAGKDIGEEGGALKVLELAGGKAPAVMVREGNGFRPLVKGDLQGRWEYAYEGKVWLEDLGR